MCSCFHGFQLDVLIIKSFKYCMAHSMLLLQHFLQDKQLFSQSVSDVHKTLALQALRQEELKQNAE